MRADKTNILELCLSNRSSTKSRLLSEQNSLILFFVLTFSLLAFGCHNGYYLLDSILCPSPFIMAMAWLSNFYICRQMPRSSGRVGVDLTIVVNHSHRYTRIAFYLVRKYL